MPFGVEVMGRVRELGSVEDVRRDRRAGRWVRPVLDFAHMHATSDGAFLAVDPFADALAQADAVLEPARRSTSTSPTSQYANRNETKHLPYGEGTLRAEPLREALARFDRPATVISESPDEASTQAIRAILGLASGIGSPDADRERLLDTAPDRRAGRARRRRWRRSASRLDATITRRVRGAGVEITEEFAFEAPSRAALGRDVTELAGPR